jgi:Family of unknown function (DUF6338)
VGIPPRRWLLRRQTPTASWTLVPTTWLTVFFYGLLVAPGLLYDLLAERRRVKVGESVFREISRTILASLIISIISFSILAVVRSVRPAWMPNPGQLFADTGGYVAGHYRLILRTLLIEGGIALGIAGGLQWMRLRRVRARLRPISTWTKVLREECPRGFLPHVQVRLSNDMTYIGRVGYFTADLETSDRELVLVPPLYVKKPDGAMRDMGPDWQRIVISGESVQSMAVQYRPDPSPSALSQGFMKRLRAHFSSSNGSTQLDGKATPVAGPSAATGLEVVHSIVPANGVQPPTATATAATGPLSPQED